MRPLDGPDLFHLAQERQGQPLHTLKIALLDRALSDGVVDRWAASVVPGIEPLRWRLGGSRWARPVWVDGGPPDLRWHVRHRVVDAPGGEPELCSILAELCGSALDRSRPLWRLWHLTGLSGGRDAVVLQLHHALADGAASVALWEALSGERTGPIARTPVASTSAVSAGARDLARLPVQFRRFGRYVRHTRAAERAGAPAVAKAFSGPSTRFNVEPEGERRCAFAVLPMPRLRALREATGATINELFLAVAGPAVRRHLEDLGEPPGASLTATVPAALPSRAHPFGNAVTTLYVSLHSDIDDPAERLGAVRRSLAASRGATAGDWRLLADWQRYPRLNGAVIAAMATAERRLGRPAYNLIASSVRGPGPFRLAGAEVVGLRSLGPVMGRFGLNLTAWSYGDEFPVGIHSYASAADRLDGLATRLEREVEALDRRIVRGALT